MSLQRFREILSRHNVASFVLPALSLLGIYLVIIFIPLIAIFGGPGIPVVATIFMTLFWFMLPDGAKEDLRQYWTDLPQLKFHAVIIGVCMLVLSTLLVFKYLFVNAGGLLKGEKG